MSADPIICEGCVADEHGRCEERWCSWCDCHCNDALHPAEVVENFWFDRADTRMGRT